MIRKIIVIQAQDIDSANDFCNGIGAEGQTFQVPLYDDLNELAGYWVSWGMTEEQLQAVESYFTWVFDTKEDALSTCGWHPALD